MPSRDSHTNTQFSANSVNLLLLFVFGANNTIRFVVCYVGYNRTTKTDKQTHGQVLQCGLDTQLRVEFPLKNRDKIHCYNTRATLIEVVGAGQECFFK